MDKEEANTKPRPLKYKEPKYKDVSPSENQPAEVAAKETLKHKTFSVPLKSEKTEEIYQDYYPESITQQHVVAPEPASHEEKGKSKEEEEQTHDCLKAKKVKLMSCDRTEPKDDDVTRHIIELREKLGWQTVLWQHNLKYDSPEVAAWKVLKETLKDGGEFVYCLPRDNIKGLYNPYDLQVVSAHIARKCKEFWIITASFISKVTKIGDNTEEIELIPALEWLSDRKRYYFLQQLKMFSNF